jgi:ketosteroid isomerase-like protein
VRASRLPERERLARRRRDVAGVLEGVANDLVEAMDARDLERMLALTDDDAQGVDEISRRWIRGSELESHLREILGLVNNVHTKLRDVTERVWGDTGVLTCWLEQRYTIEGAEQQISAPTTMIFRRSSGDWKLALFHSVPLTEHDVSDPGVTL